MMNYTHLLLRTGEIFLKGRNRNFFVNRLVGNIKKIAKVDVEKLRFRYVVKYFNGHNKLKNVFGLTSYSLAVKVPKNIDEIKKSALNVLKNKKGKFRVETKRADKTFPLKSPEINTEVGMFIEENTPLEFDLHNFDHKLSVEINEEGAYLFLETVKCHGGLPVGTGDNVVLLIENDYSLLAGLLFMKRGCDIFPIAFGKKDISLLLKYSPKKLNLKIIKKIDEVEGEVLVVGDCFDSIKKYETKKMIMRPLIAYFEKQVKEELKRFNS